MSCRSSSTARFSSDSGRNFPAPANPSALLKAIPLPLRGKPVYAYIVTSIKTKSDYQLSQQGCAPNFQGGRITLCTCKHKDRATFHPSNDLHDPWKNVWVVGLTSKTEDPSRALAYLMYVERWFPDQRALWNYLPDQCRRAKSASKSELGDLYEPKAAAKNYPHNHSSYCSPVSGHAHSSERYPNAWFHDVMLWRSQPHRLLLGQAAQSYRWTSVKMILNPKPIGEQKAMGASAHHKMYDSLQVFIENLKEP